MSRICPLFSGSGGNSTYIAAPTGSVLIDAGVSFRALNEMLQAAGGSPEEISAVFLTHTHIDHKKGLKALLNRIQAPLFATKETLATLEAENLIPAGTKLEAMEDRAQEIHGFEVRRFVTEHDCIGSCGYVFSLPDGKRISICTDLGKVTPTVRDAIRGSDVVLIESNHDIDM